MKKLSKAQAKVIAALRLGLNITQMSTSPFSYYNSQNHKCFNKRSVDNLKKCGLICVNEHGNMGLTPLGKSIELK